MPVACSPPTTYALSTAAGDSSNCLAISLMDSSESIRAFHAAITFSDPRITALGMRPPSVVGGPHPMCDRQWGGHVVRTRTRMSLRHLGGRTRRAPATCSPPGPGGAAAEAPARGLADRGDSDNRAAHP